LRVQHIDRLWHVIVMVKDELHCLFILYLWRRLNIYFIFCWNLSMHAIILTYNATNFIHCPHLAYISYTEWLSFSSIRSVQTEKIINWISHHRKSLSSPLAIIPW
jgi:hypothetical protein